MHYIWNCTLYRSRLIVAYQSGQALALVAFLATKVGGFMESFPMFLSNLLSRLKKKFHTKIWVWYFQMYHIWNMITINYVTKIGSNMSPNFCFLPVCNKTFVFELHPWIQMHNYTPVNKISPANKVEWGTLVSLCPSIYLSICPSICL